MILKILKIFSKKDKKILIGLLLFSFLISMIEIVGISAVMPFIQIVTNNNVIQTNKYYLFVYELFGFKNEINFIIFSGGLLVSFYILRSFINLVYVYSLACFTQSRYKLISTSLFKHYMESSYEIFTNKNSSTMTKNIINEAQNQTQVISSFLFVVSEIFIFLFLYTLMLLVDWRIALSLTILVAINGLLIVFVISKKIKKVGEIRAEKLTALYENINSSFGNFKIIKLRSAIKKHFDIFKNDSEKFTRTNTINITLTNVPRLFLEAFGFGMIVFIITYLVWAHNGDIVEIMPTITIFVFALYRLMPSLNRISNGYNEIIFYSKSLEIINKELGNDIEILGEDAIEYEDKISIENIDFGYHENKTVFVDVNLEIKKGTSIAITGESGSGKSTLVDVIMGLHFPTRGRICSDGVPINNNNLKSWREKVGYIPQSVYLFDGTIGENIAFGLDYDELKVDFLLKKVRLNNFLESKDGQHTLVGEDGSKLSGGQKQRVAIARALYAGSEILVLDEATSALDGSTEERVMAEIYDMSAGKTLIIIAHRISTLGRCDHIYELINGKVSRV